MYKEMMDTIGLVNTVDPELGAAMNRELTRQRQNIELIASENIVSPAVMAAMGSVLTNKYAEGLPGKRYYGGCVYVDEVENIAIQRACKLFGAKYANVQPHSGAQANLAVYFALLDLGDTVMGMDLSQGGHLTHGSPVNMSGKNYHFVSYGVNADGVIDYAELEKQVKKVRPKLIVAGASAYPRAIDFEKIAEIAHGYGAFLMVDMAHIAGLVAGGQHQSPVPYADVVTTTTHKTLRGPRGGLILTNNPVIAKRINSAVFPGTQGGPLEHVIAAKAVCFGEALKPEFKEYARKIVENAQALAAALQERGVKLVSGGTDNHLMLIDLRDEECTGKDLEARLDSVHITANKNTVPGETRSPFVTSGVRLGTPAVTTRGMGVAEMKVIADCIADCIWHYDEKKDEIHPDNGHNGAAHGHLVHQDEPGEHDGRYRADEERLGLAGHAAAAEIAADVLFINGRVGEPGVQPLGAVGKAEGREQIERHRGQNGQCNADGAQRQADAAEGNKKRFFERMHDKGPFCVR